MAAFLRAARNVPRLQHAAVASGIALSAYVLSQQPPIRAAEKESDIYIING